MGTSNPSRSRSKGIPVAGKAGGGKATVHLVTLTLGKGAAPLLEMKDGEAVATAAGRLVAEAWRTLGEGRSDLETDDFALGPYSMQGILRLKSTDPEAAGLASAIRLLKARSARALAARKGPASRRTGPKAGEAMTGIWMRGYSERMLTTLKQVVEARKALMR